MCVSTLRIIETPSTASLRSPLGRRSINHISNKRKPSTHHFVVQHNYHDHSCDQSPSHDWVAEARASVNVPFPLKLHDMLSKVEEDGYGHVASWQPHGRCFVVHKPDVFAEILPLYFKLSKIASFQRQLNLYGFTRITQGRDKGGYYHECFLRDRDWLVQFIQRVRIKGTGVRARSNPDQEPDFWQMAWVSKDIPKMERPKAAPARPLPSSSDFLINMQPKQFVLQHQQQHVDEELEPLPFETSSVFTEWRDSSFFLLDNMQGAAELEPNQVFSSGNKIVSDEPEEVDFDSLVTQLFMA